MLCSKECRYPRVRGNGRKPCLVSTRAEQKAESRSGIKQDRATEPARWETSLTELRFVVTTCSAALLKEGTAKVYGKKKKKKKRVWWSGG